METEQLQQILQVFEEFKNADILAAIFMIVGFLGMVACIIYLSIRDEKIKKWRKEYEVTLTEEQRKKLKEWREIK